jgi:hypothetical protein
VPVAVNSHRVVDPYAVANQTHVVDVRVVVAVEDKEEEKDVQRYETPSPLELV